MKDLVTVVLVGVSLVAASGGAGEKENAARDRLSEEHTNAAGTFTVRTPQDWVFETRAGEPEVTEARGGTLVLRVVRREGQLARSVHA